MKEPSCFDASIATQSHWQRSDLRHRFFWSVYAVGGIAILKRSHWFVGTEGRRIAASACMTGILVLLFPWSLEGKDRIPSEVKTEVLIEQDRTRQKHCGTRTSMLVPGDSVTDLTTAVEVELLLLSTDARALQGAFRLRVVRVNYDRGTVNIIGVPWIEMANLSAPEADAPLRNEGPIIREDDRFISYRYSFDLVRSVLSPNMLGRELTITFKDSLAITGDETIRFRIQPDPVDGDSLRKCIEAMSAEMADES